MTEVLAAQNHALLAQIARSRVLLAFDFDGTLAPIVADRDAGRMRAETRTLLERVCQRYPCAVISGRGLADVRSRLSGVPLKHVIGNHGLEAGGDMSTFRRQVAAVRPELEAALEGLSGVDVEDKSLSLAIHYRQSAFKEETRQAICDAVAAFASSMRVIPGKLVVNVIPDHAPHKGDALVRLLAHEGSDTAIYVGDDVTDEDVFALDQPGLLSIRVGRSESSSADYFLREQEQIDQLLARLADLRER